MTDPREWIAQAKARCDAATAATHGLPWVVDPDDPAIVLASKDGGWDGSRVVVAQRDDFGLIEESVTEFIAHARTDLPRALAALEAVLDRHGETQWYCADEHHDAKLCPCGDLWCDSCGERWPCPDYRAITAALDGAS